jgi:hypothetical protein
VEAVLRRPAHRHQRWPRLCPRPLDTAEDRVGEGADLGLVRIVAVEVRLAKQHAGDQPGGVDGGQLDVAVARAGRHVDEVVEEAAVAGHSDGIRSLRRVAQEPQRDQHPLDRLGAADPAVLGADRHRGEAEADRSHARERRRRPAVRHQAVGRIGRAPEPAEGAPLQLVDERVDLEPRDVPARHARRRRVGLLASCGCDRLGRRRRDLTAGAGAEPGCEQQQRRSGQPGQDAGGGFHGVHRTSAGREERRGAHGLTRAAPSQHFSRASKPNLTPN